MKLVRSVKKVGFNVQSLNSEFSNFPTLGTFGALLPPTFDCVVPGISPRYNIGVSQAGRDGIAPNRQRILNLKHSYII